MEAGGDTCFLRMQKKALTSYPCQTALLKLTNDILWSMEHQEVTALMAIDLLAAFDTMDHNILLDILNKKFGVGGKAGKWFDSYLHPRSCKANIGKTYSANKDLTFSVPQGSCAGAVLYLTYMQALCRKMLMTMPLNNHLTPITGKLKQRLLRILNHVLQISRNGWMKTGYG